MFRPLILITISTLVFFSCGKGKNESEVEEITQQESTDQEIEVVNTPIVSEDGVSGRIVLEVEGEEIIVDEFRDTNLLVTDMILNATLITPDNKSVILAIPGNSIESLDIDEPVEVGLSQISFTGFLKPGDTDDQLWLKEGKVYLNKLDLENKVYAMSFEGTGGQLMDAENKNPVKMKGSVEMTIGNLNDMRSVKDKE